DFGHLVAWPFGCEQNAGAGLGEGAGDAQTDAGGAAGDQGRFAGEHLRHRLGFLGHGQCCRQRNAARNGKIVAFDEVLRGRTILCSKDGTPHDAVHSCFLHRIFIMVRNSFGGLMMVWLRGRSGNRHVPCLSTRISTSGFGTGKARISSATTGRMRQYSTHDAERVSWPYGAMGGWRMTETPLL